MDSSACRHQPMGGRLQTYQWTSNKPAFKWENHASFPSAMLYVIYIILYSMSYIYIIQSWSVCSWWSYEVQPVMSLKYPYSLLSVRLGFYGSDFITLRRWLWGTRRPSASQTVPGASSVTLLYIVFSIKTPTLRLVHTAFQNSDMVLSTNCMI